MQMYATQNRVPKRCPIRYLFWGALFFAALSPVVRAETVDALTYTGKIVNADGTNITSTQASCVRDAQDTCDFRVRMYTEKTAGTLVWEDTINDVELGENSGRFSLILACGGSFDACNKNGGVDFSTQEIYIEVELDRDGDADFAEGEVFSPRKELTAVPYAFHAQNATELDGKTADSFVRTDADTTLKTGTTLTFAGDVVADGNVTINDTDITFGGATTNIDTSGDFSLNTQSLFVRKSDGNIGIGTTAPTQALHVIGDTRITNALYIGDDDARFQYNTMAGMLRIEGAQMAGSSVEITSTSNMIKGAVRIGSMAVFDEVGERFGLGTQSPSAKMHIVSAKDEILLQLSAGQDAPAVMPLLRLESNYESDSLIQGGKSNDTFARFNISAGGIMEFGSGIIQRDTNLYRVGVDTLGTDDSFYVAERLGIGVAVPAYPIELESGAHVTVGGVWTNASDVNLKENFTDVDGEELLEKLSELQISRWNYKSEDKDITHIGPTAQDFFALFGLGGTDTSISTIDPAGIALIGVQELYKKQKEIQERWEDDRDEEEERNSNITQLQKEIEQLQEQYTVLADAYIALDIDVIAESASDTQDSNSENEEEEVLNQEDILTGDVQEDKNNDVSVTISDAGTATIERGQGTQDGEGVINTVFVGSTIVTQESIIHITPRTSTGGMVPYIANISQGEGFEVRIDGEINDNIDINWWVIEVPQESKE